MGGAGPLARGGLFFFFFFGCCCRAAAVVVDLDRSSSFDLCSVSFPFWPRRGRRRLGRRLHLGPQRPRAAGSAPGPEEGGAGEDVDPERVGRPGDCLRVGLDFVLFFLLFSLRAGFPPSPPPPHPPLPPLGTRSPKKKSPTSKNGRAEHTVAITESGPKVLTAPPSADEKLDPAGSAA